MEGVDAGDGDGDGEVAIGVVEVGMVVRIRVVVVEGSMVGPEEEMAPGNVHFAFNLNFPNSSHQTVYTPQTNQLLLMPV